jgi:hypothetical protein
MQEVLRTLAVHQGLFHKRFLDSWGAPEPELITAALEALVYDGLWLTKFPLLWTPAYGVRNLDTLNKAWQPPAGLPPADAAAQIAELRPRVDADTLRFVLKLTPEELETRVEIYFGGRALNKPLWQYLLAWFEHGAVLRARLNGPGLWETVFS